MSHSKAQKQWNAQPKPADPPPSVSWWLDTAKFYELAKARQAELTPQAVYPKADGSDE